MSLESLGWNGLWLEKFKACAGTDLVPARVVGEHRSHYQVATGTTEHSAGVTGRLRNKVMHRSDLPGVGDFVAVKVPAGDSASTIEEVLPRTSALIRRASGTPEPQLLAANVDVAFIVTALGGDFNLPRLKRYISMVKQSGVEPVIVVNKSDMMSDVAGLARGEIDPTIPVHLISARVRESIQLLHRYFEGHRTIVLLGSSGVGKSTLTNQLLGREAQLTQEVRGYDGRGQHTTTSRHLLTLPLGGVVVDTPGLRGLELWNAEEVHHDNFDDIKRVVLQCRFRNCRHETEPGCAVRSAVVRGDLDATRLAAYIKHAS
jgi:ribosome biogenesis GTPase